MWPYSSRVRRGEKGGEGEVGGGSQMGGKGEGGGQRVCVCVCVRRGGGPIRGKGLKKNKSGAGVQK